MRTPGKLLAAAGFGPPLLALSCAAGAAEPLLRDTLAACRAIESEPVRLACYDKAIDVALRSPARVDIPRAEPTAPPSPVVSTEAPGAVKEPAPAAPSAPSAPPVSEDLFGLDAKSLQALSEEALAAKAPEQLDAEIAACRQNAAGKWRIELTNGQRWHQTDTTPLRLRSGDAVRISRRALGSHLLKRLKGGKAIAVRREA